MTSRCAFRVKIYKGVLRRLIAAKKDVAYKIRLTKVTARQLAEQAQTCARGVTFSNVARDIRMLTEPGERYDAEFDLLYRGQVVPEVVDNYSETFLSRIVKGVVAPCDMDARLADLSRRRPDGRRTWEEL